MAKLLTDLDERDICTRRIAGERNWQLALKYGVSGATISRVIRRNGLFDSDRNRFRSWYPCNHSFFSEVTAQDQAYWLGFLAADGNIESRKPALLVSLAIKDESHLYAFRKALGSGHPIRTRFVSGGPTSLSGTKFQCCYLSIYSSQIVSDLARYGITPRKTFTLPWPDLPEHLLRHYLRGYLDGDGSFYLTKGGSTISFMVMGNEAFLLDCRDYLVRKCSLSAVKLQQRFKNCDAYMLRYNGKPQVRAIADLLYEGAAVYLERKHSIAVAAVPTRSRNHR